MKHIYSLDNLILNEHQFDKLIKLMIIYDHRVHKIGNYNIIIIIVILYSKFSQLNI